MGEPKLLEYFPFSSNVNPSFWHKLTEIKLDIDKLNETSRQIWGHYSNLTSIFSGNPLLEVDSTSFNIDCSDQNVYMPAQGVLLNKNTIEQFKDCDKNELLHNERVKICEWIKNGEAANNPFLLNFFFVLSFADLKKYNYYYWFCFPAPPKINVNLLTITPAFDIFKENEARWQIDEVLKGYNQLDIQQKPFFLVKSTTESAEILPLKSVKNLENSINLADYYFAFADPSTSPNYPGWPLRNYIAFLLYTCPFLSGNTVQFLAFRLGRERIEVSFKYSFIFRVVLPSIDIQEIFNSETAWLGWERNERQKFGPRASNMKNSIDPKCLAETSVDLNLKLMKWQLLPNINLEKIKHCKCLLLGSGTLGCSVARILLGWGTRTITFVDNACVSFSNPVRQSLFTYEDCNRNRHKAEAAADNLKKIFPGVESKGYHFSIPMPGHPVGESLLSQTEQNVKTLSDLISEHDIIFLLMDSRESRWLPTLLGSYFKKIVINAALGFDTYLVMRHGIRAADVTEEAADVTEEAAAGTSSGGIKAIPGNKLGCYFCNDVTAPGNSLKDRTLDQQCTVTRPGISPIAGALAVELAISILQHPDGAKAPAYYKAGNRELGDENMHEESILGIVPHSIRGFLSTFNQVLPATEQYKQCVACSDIVVEEYRANGFQFLLKVFDSCKYLEKLTGLSEMQEEMAHLEVWNLDDIEDSDE